MKTIEEINEYIKTLKRDIIVLQHLLYEQCIKEVDELEYYEEYEPL